MLAIVLVCTACDSGSPSRAEAKGPRLVVLLATCSLDRFALEPYDGEIESTPALAELAKQGLVFDAHRSDAGLSGVAFASLFSGSSALRHGVMTHPTELPDDLPLLAEAFADAGWQTFAFQPHAMASAQLGYARGVPVEHRYSERPLVGRDRLLRRRPMSRILDHLANDPGTRAYVQTAFAAAHAPYPRAALADYCDDFPDECSAVFELGDDRLDELIDLYRRNIAALAFNDPVFADRLDHAGFNAASTAQIIDTLYRANVARFDALIGELLEAIDVAGLRDSTLFVLTSDHGEDRQGEAPWGRWTHSHSLGDRVLGVPLIISGAGVPTGRYEAVSRSIDINPTIRGLVGLANDEDTSEGVDLSRAILGLEPVPELDAFSHTGILPAPVLAWPNESTEALRRHFPTPGVESTWFALRRRNTTWTWQRGLDGSWKASARSAESGPPKGDIFDPNDAEHRRAVEQLESLRDSFLHMQTGEAPIDTQENRLKLKALGYL